MAAAYAFVLSLFIAMALVPPLCGVAGRLGLTDNPGGRKVHQQVTPCTGGIAIFLGFLAPVLLWMPLRQDLHAFLVAAAVLFVFGVLDDRFNLDYRIKLLGQALAALIVTLWGGVVIWHFPFVPDEGFPALIGIPFTVFVLTGITNAVNLSDGLDGLAGGMSLLAIAAVLLLAGKAADGPLVMVALATMGATLGFLRYNTHPARVFMGDSGSQFVGFSAGVLAVIVTQISNPALSPVLPVLLLGLPILDTLTVMTRRIAEGRSPFEADRTHLHHRLLDLGFTQYEVVAAVYAAQALLMVLACLLRYSSDTMILTVYSAFAIAVLFGISRLDRISASIKGRAEGDSVVGRIVAAARRTAFLKRYAFFFLHLGVPLFLVWGALRAEVINRDIALQAGLLAFGFVVTVSVRRWPFDFLERVIAYATAVTVVYLLGLSDGLMSTCGRCIHLLLGVAAIVTAVWVRFSDRSFRVSTLDLLIVMVAIALPSLAGDIFRGLGVVALESIILFYAIEVILTDRDRNWDLLSFGVLGALCILTTRGLLA
jgi:UDP-GlcNAc:undecaprenyl-phosphate GlcNAc-1-phosphate transferase